MPTLNVDGLMFTFPAGWQKDKYDEWSFYRNQFSKQNDNIKAVDVLAVSPTQAAYLIEVKDYRHPDTEKPSELPQAIAKKVLDTLAAMLPAKFLANDPSEKQLAVAILSCTSLHVIAHIEQAARHQQVIDPADLKQKLRRLLRSVDPHLKVVAMNNMVGLEWTVS
jgi:hypothetical protein